MDIREELQELMENSVWTAEEPPIYSHVLHTKWVLKKNTDADGMIERYKARLVACGNEKLFGVDHGLTFTAVMEISNVKWYWFLQGNGVCRQGTRTSETSMQRQKRKSI